jgi:uroporphyrinogen-III decarboxylase
MKKSQQELYQEKEKRTKDAIELKVPDRVPIEMAFQYFPARYAGISSSAAYYDADAWLAACKKTLLDFDVDLPSLQGYFPGKVLELIEPRTLRWPGFGPSSLPTHQAVEGEHMKADEYDVYMKNPADFILRLYMPRVSGVMEPWKSFPQLSTYMVGYHGTIAIGNALNQPDMIKSIKTLQKVAREFKRELPRLKRFNEGISRLGFPAMGSGMGIAPFDSISDSLRGMQGTMLDMYRQPDRLLELCESILQGMISRIKPAQPGSDNRVMIPTHRGSAGFMSLKQFEKFYWPTMRRFQEALIERGLTPLVFWEGDYTDRLEYLLELPKGKVFSHFDMTDIFRAKEVLNGHMSLGGNFPISLLQAGSEDDVKALTRKMIDVVGKDGGFIMSTRSPVDDANPKLLKVFIDFTKEYGVYH